MSGWETGEWCRDGLAWGTSWGSVGLVGTAPTAGEPALAAPRTLSLEALGVCAWRCPRAVRWRVRSPL